jgi:nuclear pore complex protein Nup205
MGSFFLFIGKILQVEFYVILLFLKFKVFPFFSNLRQEQQPGIETVYRSRVISRNINPQEIAGLQTVLDLIRAVAENDEVARIALCEQPSWAPLHVLLGLVSCSILIPLKSNLSKLYIYNYI